MDPIHITSPSGESPFTRRCVGPRSGEGGGAEVAGAEDQSGHLPPSEMENRRAYTSISTVSGM